LSNEYCSSKPKLEVLFMIAVARFGLLFTWASKLAAFSIAGKTTDWLA
jgi:hypothetical protein